MTIAMTIVAVSERHERVLGEMPVDEAFAKLDLKWEAELNGRVALPPYNFGIGDQVVIGRLEISEVEASGHKAGLSRGGTSVQTAEALCRR